MVLFELVIDGREVDQALSGLGRLASAPRPLMERICGEIERSTKERFITKTGPDGRRWQELSPVTRSLKGSNDILIQERRLVDGIKASVTGTEEATLSTAALPYAYIQQFGGSAGRNQKVRIPPRPYLGISVQDEAAIATEVLSAIAGALKR